MKILKTLLLFHFSVLCFSQNQALYYFNKGFDEFSGKYPPLNFEGQKGYFTNEIVEKFGKEKRQVYRILENSGLMFDNTKVKNFINGSYAIEMYFKYDNGSMLLYNQLLGDDLNEKQGKYVHLVTTRDAKSKKLNVFIDGQLKVETMDESDNLEITSDSQVSFFSDPGRQTTSGTVAMIKLYNFFISKEEAPKLFEAFSNKVSLVENSPVGVIDNLYFLKSQAIFLPESLPELENIADYLKDNSKINVELQGHTDNQGDFNLNMSLSKARAAAVKKYLIEKGISDKRIKTRGFGSTKPVASNATEETRRKNRRVELQEIK